MKKKFMIITCCFLMLVLTACGNPKLKDGKEVIASIDGKEFSVDDLYNDLKKNYGENALLTMIDTYIAEKEIETTKEIEDYVNEVVEYWVSYSESTGADSLEDFLSGYMQIYGISTEEEFYDFVMSDYKLSLAVEQQIRAMITEDEIKDYYDESYTEKITVRHILIEAAENDTNGEKAKKQAEDLIKELNKVDKDELEDKFSELAEEYSDDSSYSDGGLIEDFMASGVVEEFWDASKDLKIGEYTTEPVKTDYGYHIIYKVSEKEKETLEDATEEIKETLTANNMQSGIYVNQAKAELRKKYNLKIYDKDIETSYNKSLEE